MVDSTAVDVSLLWSELQHGELAVGHVSSVDVRHAGCDVLGQVEGVSGPGDPHWSRIETSHMTDESVVDSQLNMVSGVDGGTRLFWRHQRQKDTQTLYTVCHKMIGKSRTFEEKRWPLTMLAYFHPDFTSLLSVWHSTCG